MKNQAQVRSHWKILGVALLSGVVCMPEVAAQVEFSGGASASVYAHSGWGAPKTDIAFLEFASAGSGSLSASASSSDPFGNLVHGRAELYYNIASDGRSGSVAAVFEDISETGFTTSNTSFGIGYSGNVSINARGEGVRLANNNARVEFSIGSSSSGSQQGSGAMVWSVNEDPLPGPSPEKSIPPYREQSCVGAGCVEDEIDLEEPILPPVGVHGCNLLEGNTQKSGKSASQFYQYYYAAPVIAGGYGYQETTYFGETSIKSGASENPIAGYLFVNNLGSAFTSFTIPTALPGGDSELELHVDQQSYSLNAGDTFDFLDLDTEGVESFALLGIDPSEKISYQEGVPFAFGITNSAGPIADFAAFPLISIAPASCEPVNNLLGDLDADGTVAFADFLILSANFEADLSLVQENTYTLGDLDCSGDVGFADFLSLSANFGKSLNGSLVYSVPEVDFGARYQGLVLIFAVLVGRC